MTSDEILKRLDSIMKHRWAARLQAEKLCEELAKESASTPVDVEWVTRELKVMRTYLEEASYPGDCVNLAAARDMVNRMIRQIS